MGYVGPRGKPLSEFLSWSPEDQTNALSWQAHEAARCSTCGRHPDDPPRHPHVERCPDCAALAAARRQADPEQGEHVVWAAGAREHCPTCNETPRRR